MNIFQDNKCGRISRGVRRDQAGTLQILRYLAEIGDLDGDGDMDILDKPYTWKTPRIDVFMQEGKNK